MSNNTPPIRPCATPASGTRSSSGPSGSSGIFADTRSIARSASEHPLGHSSGTGVLNAQNKGTPVSPRAAMRPVPLFRSSSSQNGPPHRPLGVRARSTAPYTRTTPSAPEGRHDRQTSVPVTTSTGEPKNKGVNGISSAAAPGSVGRTARPGQKALRLSQRDHDKSDVKGGAGNLKDEGMPAQLPLYRKLLFPTWPADKPVPPIVLGEGAELEAINERSYRLIALLLRAHILSWYPSITKDRTLLPHICNSILVPVLSPILTGIKDRPDRIIDFVLKDLPRAVELHVRTYRQTRAAMERRHELNLVSRPVSTIGLVDRVNQPFLHPALDEIELGKMYHAHLPLRAIIASPDDPPASTHPYRTPVVRNQQIISPTYLTSVADAILREHLPPPEYACEVERAMGREVLGRLVLGAVLRRVGEGWFWLDMAIRLLGKPKARPVGGIPDSVREGVPMTPTSETPMPIDFASRCKRLAQSFVDFSIRIWVVITWVVSLARTVLSTVLSYSNAASLASDKDLAAPWVSMFREVLGVDGRCGLYPAPWAVRLAWGTVEAGLALCGPILDRAIPPFIQQRLDSSLALTLIDKLENTLLPMNGYPGPTVPDPHPTEVAEMHRDLMLRLHEVLPPWFSDKPRRTGIISEPENAPQATIENVINDVSSAHLIVEPFMSPGCNAHLLSVVLEGLIGALVPAMKDRPNGVVDGISGKGVERSGVGYDVGVGHEGVGIRWRTTRRAGALADAMDTER